MPISFLVCLEPIPVRTSKIEKQNTNDAGEFFFLLSTALREITLYGRSLFSEIPNKTVNREKSSWLKQTHLPTQKLQTL